MTDTKSRKYVHDLVYNFGTTYKEGFMVEEMSTLVKMYPDITWDDFCDKMGVNTCIIIDNNIITYHCDVYTALICCLEDRDKTLFEFD